MVRYLPLFTTGFSTIQTVVGLGISEASTVFYPKLYRPLEVRRFLLETIIFRGKMLVWGKVPSWELTYPHLSPHFFPVPKWPNDAPVDMVNIPFFTGFYTSQVVVWDFWSINSRKLCGPNIFPVNSLLQLEDKRLHRSSINWVAWEIACRVGVASVGWFVQGKFKGS